jgi:hypothetical protein
VVGFQITASVKSAPKLNILLFSEIGIIAFQAYIFVRRKMMYWVLKLRIREVALLRNVS